MPVSARQTNGDVPLTAASAGCTAAKALRLRAEDHEDLAVISACLQDALVTVGDLAYDPEMQNFVLIGAPAHSGNEVMGSLAVIGPTRMDYQHTITAVSYIARLFDKILNESE